MNVAYAIAPGQKIETDMNTANNKMQVEIWSDIMCPFCYIGKRKFETALSQFDGHDDVEVIWKSFQLDPNQPTLPDKSIYEYLSERKGMSVEQAHQMIGQITMRAEQVGLTFNFDTAVTANSFDAHRLLHLAQEAGKQDETKEALLSAYFTEGKNIADAGTLTQIGEKVGLDAGRVNAMLQSDEYTDDVQHDIYESRQLGVQGVPFFVLNRKYAVSGAQESDTFLGALQTAHGEWKAGNQPQELVLTDGPVCTPDGVCA